MGFLQRSEKIDFLSLKKVTTSQKNEKLNLIRGRLVSS